MPCRESGTGGPNLVRVECRPTARGRHSDSLWHVAFAGRELGLALLYRSRSGSGGLKRYFADLAQDDVGPSDIVQPHDDFTTEASEQARVAGPHVTGQHFERAELRLRPGMGRQRRAGIRRDFNGAWVEGNSFGAGPDPHRVAVLQLRRASEAGCARVPHRQPFHRLGSSKAFWLCAEATRRISGVCHDSHASDTWCSICASQCVSRQNVRYLGSRSPVLDVRRAQDLHEQRTDETYN